MIRAIAGLVAVVLMGACGQPTAHTRIEFQPSPGSVPSLPVHPVMRHVPARLQIPAIGVDAAVESVGVVQDGSSSALSMAVPSHPEEVGWYSPGAAPGDATGDVVMDGHLDSQHGPAVFWRLRELQAGASVVVVAEDGSVSRWRVRQIADFPYQAHPPGLFDGAGPHILSLITCTGTWDGHIYQRRRVVTAVPA